MPTAACPVCDEVAAVVPGRGREVTVGTIAAAVERPPVVACPAQHVASPVAVVDAAMTATREQIPLARRRRLTGEGCQRCRAPLTMPVRRTTRAVTVEPELGAVFTLRFDLPSTRCGDCGTDQVPRRSLEDLAVVVPALLSPPDGP